MNYRHKVFVSYYHEEDQYYRERFEGLFSDYYDIMVSNSVQLGDIDDELLSTERIRQIIRDDYLQSSTVTVVLVGAHTWQRKLRDHSMPQKSRIVAVLLFEAIRENYQDAQVQKERQLRAEKATHKALEDLTAEFRVKRDNILRQAVHAEPELVERAAERIQSYFVRERLP